MKTLANLLTTFLITSWVIVIAILSVQNYTPVSLKFLTFQSIQVPVGLVLAFSAGVGMIGMTLLQLLWSLASGQNNSQSEDEDEFFADEEY